MGLVEEAGQEEKMLIFIRNILWKRIKNLGLLFQIRYLMKI
jgi:hypothetical protein